MGSGSSQPSAGRLSCANTSAEPSLPWLWGCVLLEVRGGHVQISRGLFLSPHSAAPALAALATGSVPGLLLVPSLCCGLELRTVSERWTQAPLFVSALRGIILPSPDVQCLENGYFTRFDCLAP